MFLPLTLPLFLPTERQAGRQREPEGFAELEFLLAEPVTRATEQWDLTGGLGKRQG